MHVKSVVSAIALSAALALSAPAFAQTMLNGAEVSADDLPAVQERCDQLKLAADTDGVSESGDAGSTDSDADEPSSAADASTETDGAEAVNEAADALTTVDLDTITLEACVDAGLVSAM